MSPSSQRYMPRGTFLHWMAVDSPLLRCHPCQIPQTSGQHSWKVADLPLLPLDLVGDESGIFDIHGLTLPPIPPRSRSLSPMADPVGLWEESGLTPPTMSLGLEIIPTQSDGSKLETDPIVTTGMGSAGPSKSPKIDLGTVELTDTESHSSSSMDISSENEPRPQIPTPPVLGLTTEQMEGTNNIYSS